MHDGLRSREAPSADEEGLQVPRVDGVVYDCQRPGTRDGGDFCKRNFQFEFPRIFSLERSRPFATHRVPIYRCRFSD